MVDIRGDSRRPIVWSVAGNDSGGGAGLAADLRAAEAFGVHLCPVIAAITAQNSRAVTRVETDGDRISRVQNYFFTPDFLAEVCPRSRPFRKDSAAAAKRKRGRS